MELHDQRSRVGRWTCLYSLNLYVAWMAFDLDGHSLPAALVERGGAVASLIASCQMRPLMLQSWGIKNVFLAYHPQYT